MIPRQAILKYAVKNLSSEEYEKCVVDVLEKNTFLLGTMDCEEYIKAPTSFVIKRMLQGETTTGDARQENKFFHEITIYNVNNNSAALNAHLSKSRILEPWIVCNLFNMRRTALV